MVLRCYLSLTCHGCHILMDGKQIGRRERREHQDINKDSLCISPLLRLSHNTQLLTAGFLVVEQMVILGTLTRWFVCLFWISGILERLCWTGLHQLCDCKFTVPKCTVFCEHAQRLTACPFLLNVPVSWTEEWEAFIWKKKKKKPMLWVRPLDWWFIYQSLERWQTVIIGSAD